MSIQLLVNVLSVGPLASGASVVVPHGLRSNDEAVRPTLIQPNQGTPIIVVPGSVNELTATFQNPSAAPASAVFRFERGLSNELDADTVGDLFWAGAATGSGGGVNSVGVTAPIVNTGTATDPVIGVSNALAGSTGVVQLAAGLGGAGSAAATPKLDMDHATSGTLAALRGGTGLAGSGGANDIGKVLMANGAGGWSASSIVLARTYYVAVNGSDTTGDGSISKSFATIGAALTQASADLLSSEYAKIVVGPGTYVGNVTINRARTIIQGSSGQAQVFSSRISGQVLVNISGSSKFADVLSISGFYIQPTVVTDSALRLVNSANTQTVVSDCYITTTSSNAGAWAIDEGTSGTGASQPRFVIQDSVVVTQAGGPSQVIGLYNAETRIFRSMLGHTSGVAGLGSSTVVMSAGSTLWADNTVFDTQSSLYRAIFATGTSPAAPAVKVLVSNSSISNTGNGGGVFLNTGVTAFFTQTQISVPAAVTYAVAGTGTLAYANLTFPAGTQTALQPTLVAADEVHGRLLLPSLGAGMLVKATATSPVTVQAAPLAPGLVPVPVSVTPGLIDGQVVAVNNAGTLVAADNASINTAPAQGLYVTGGYIRVAGDHTVAGPLTPGTLYYLGTGGALSATPPVGTGKVVQVVGRATSATTIFVSLTNILIN